MELGQSKRRHIYLELLYVRRYDRFSRMNVFNDRGSSEDQQMLEELKALPELLPRYQQQVERFLIWSWMWTGPDGIPGSRRPSSTSMTHPGTRSCLHSVPSP